MLLVANLSAIHLGDDSGFTPRGKRGVFPQIMMVLRDRQPLAMTTNGFRAILRRIFGRKTACLIG